MLSRTMWRCIQWDVCAHLCTSDTQYGFVAMILRQLCCLIHILKVTKLTFLKAEYSSKIILKFGTGFVIIGTLLLEEWSINFTHNGGATQESSKGGPCDQLVFLWHLSAPTLRPVMVRTPHSWIQRLEFKMFSVMYIKNHQRDTY